MRRKSLFLVMALTWAGSLHAQAVRRVDAAGLTVSDMTDALEFYTTVLPFTIVSDVEVLGESYESLKGMFGIRYRKVRLQLGNEYLELTDYLTVGGRAIPPDSRSNDLWFQHVAIVVSDMDAAYAQLRKHSVKHVSTAPQRLPKSIPAAEGIQAFYFQDPDGHVLELIFFPPGKGDPRWQQPNGKLFLGIDHTAIGVRATEASKTFYGELLGITFRGESYNYGNEQAHLNNVPGARLHITGNRAAEGLGVEFLQYLEPGPGRSIPVDARADDLLHWETIVVTDDIDALFAKLEASSVTFVSDQIQALPASYGHRRGFYVKDPDGHVVGVFAR